MQRLLPLFIIIFYSFNLPVFAQRVKLEVSAQKFSPTPIAIAKFNSNSPELSEKIRKAIIGDLTRSGLFNVLPEQNYGEYPLLEQVPNFEIWKDIGAVALVVGDVKIENGNVTTKFRLWDNYSGTEMSGQRLSSNISSHRRLGHKISDIIYNKMTGEGAYFDSRIVFVDETGSKKNRRKRLAIMDQDGANLRYITDGKESILSPRYSMKNHKVVYTTLSRRGSSLYIVDTITGKKKRLLHYDNRMVFAPALSPDGNKIALSLEYEGDTDIYIYDLISNSFYGITSGFAIDTSPSFSPDGSKIVFNSDRGGSQQLYIMDISGGTPKRISYGNGRYATPTWSPTGDKIAFTRMYKGKFAVGIMKTDGSNERILASSFLDEAPSWSPNGRSIIFFRQSSGRKGQSYLYHIDISGHISEKHLPTRNYASDPSWSPLL